MKGDTWCKFHVKAIWSPSLRKLTATQRWVWCTLLALATEGDGIIRGNAANMSHISAASATDVRGMQQALAKMQHLCLINVRKNGDIKIRNWPKYQSTTAERRERKARRNSGEKRQPAATDKKLEVDKDNKDKTPTAGEANKYFYDTLGNYATDMASVIKDFEATRKGGKIQPSVIIKIVDSWKPFGGNLLLEAKKEWDKGRYAKEGMKENYFLGICRRLKGQTEFRRRKGLP